MKKFILSVILGLAVFLVSPVSASEIEEDYLDIAANFCTVGDYNSAIVYLEKILAINPDNKQAADLKKGLAHVVAQDKKSFITSLNPLVKQAMEYQRIGKEELVLSTLQKATQIENPHIAYFYLGNYYRNNGIYSMAIDSYNKALSLKPDFIQVYLVTGATLFEMGKYDAVINPIDKYLTFEKNDDLAYAIKSRAEFELGRVDESKIDNDKAIEINKCPEYLFDRAKILYKMEDYNSAKKLFSELLPYIQTSKIYEYMGYCDYAMGNYMEALMNIDKALILSDDDEYLKNKYNEIKDILESKRDE